MSTVVFIADDSKLVSTFAQMALKGLSGVVTYTVNGLEALLALANEHPPTHILIDHHLDGLDATEIAQLLKVKNTTCKAKIYVMAGDGVDLNKAALAQNGVSGFLAKPFGCEEIQDLVRVTQPVVRAAAVSLSQSVLDFVHELKLGELPPLPNFIQDAGSEKSMFSPGPFLEAPILRVPEPVSTRPLAPDRSEIEALTRRVIEEVVWQVVPDLAERLIKKEIARLLHEAPSEQI